MEQRIVNVILLSEARNMLLDFYVQRLTPELIRKAVALGKRLCESPNQMTADEVAKQLRVNCGEACLKGNASACYMQTDDDPLDVRAIIVSGVDENPYRTVVLRGIAFLDVHSPGWREKINVEDLNLFSHRYCVLGQLTGDTYTTGCMLFGLDYELAGENSCDPKNPELYGFIATRTAGSLTPSEERLTEEWKLALR